MYKAIGSMTGIVFVFLHTPIIISALAFFIAGYKKYFRGKTTRAVSSPVGLKQEACGYYCYRKAVDEEQEQQTIWKRVSDYIRSVLI